MTRATQPTIPDRSERDTWPAPAPPLVVTVEYGGRSERVELAGDAEAKAVGDAAMKAVVMLRRAP